MARKPEGELRRGWTTGACATAATKAALTAFWGDGFPDHVTIALPRGEAPEFAVAHRARGDGWTEAGITKDAGDDPDVTHGALIVVRVCDGTAGQGVRFVAGKGVGVITKPGLPVPVGEAAVNPVPRQMMTDVVKELSVTYSKKTDIDIRISIPGGEELARKTWNPRLGIKGGLSVLGTTGVVRPFSCAAWIASIHRGIDVARADGLTHVAGCTGATSERVVQAHHGLPDHAMLDMGDFAGGLLKYLARHPVEKVTIGGGFAKMVKLAQGAGDLHSGRSQVDFETLSNWLSQPDVAGSNTAMEVLENVPEAGQIVADKAHAEVVRRLDGSGVAAELIIVDRAGNIAGQAA